MYKVIQYLQIEDELRLQQLKCNSTVEKGEFIYCTALLMAESLVIAAKISPACLFCMVVSAFVLSEVTTVGINIIIPFKNSS